MKSKTETYWELNNKFIEETGLEEGDTVKVIRGFFDGEMGFRGGVWEGMDDMIGHTFEITKTLHGDGVHKDGITINDFLFPFFAIELVKKGEKLPDPIQLDNSPYEVEFQRNGAIEVGCIKISFDKLKEIYDTAETLFNSNCA